MLKALLWKEWREQRPIALTGLFLAGLLPLFIMGGASIMTYTLDSSTLFDAYLILLAILLWPLFAAAAGASTVAGEVGEGTLGFLLSRPVSRFRAWAIKVLVGTGTVLLIMTGSLGVALLLRRFAAPSADLAAMLDSFLSNRAAFFATLAFGMVFLFLSWSVFFSTLVSRPLTAAAAGILAASACLLGSLLVWWHLDPAPWVEPLWLGAQLLFLGALILGASLLIFARGELLRGQALRRAVLPAAALIVAGFPGVTLPFAYAKSVLQSTRAALTDVEISPRGDRVATTVWIDYPRTPQVWMIPIDGGSRRRLRGNLAFGPIFSPNGEWVAYFSPRNFLGFPIGSLDLRVMRWDGSADRAILSGLPSEGASLWYFWTAAFAPDGERVAVTDGEKILLARLNSPDRETYSLDSTSFRGGRMLGWSEDGGELLFYGRFGPLPKEHTLIGAWNLNTRKTRILFDRFISTALPRGLENPRGMRRIAVFTKEAEDPHSGCELELVDARTGTTENISPHACRFAASLDQGERLVAYADCSTPPGPGRRHSQVHLRDLERGVDTVLSDLEGTTFSIKFSPDGDQLLVRRASRADLPDLVMDLRGGTQPIEAGWRPLGWAGSGRALVARAPDAAHPAAMGTLDTRSGKISIIHSGLAPKIFE